MARLLITGGAGYVGSHCAKAAALAGHECLSFDNLLFGHRDFVRWGPLIEGDIRDASALARVFSEYRIDAVMHFAGLAHVGESIVEPGRYYDVNVNGTCVLLTAMCEAGVRRIVFSSSCAVYGQPQHVPICEAAEKHPINPYGYSKLVCERMMDDFGGVHGLRSVRLRYFNAAGADSDGEIGEDHQPETHIIPLVLDAALGRRHDVRIFGSDYPTHDGTAVRDFVHVTDLADAHVRALEYILSGGETISLNLGAGEGVSVAELIGAARLVTGAKIPIVMDDRRPGDPALLVANATKAANRLNWSAHRSDLQTILKDAWFWHRKRFGKLWMTQAN
jgi:UDP-glucose-4-epimerase GalE